MVLRPRAQKRLGEKADKVIGILKAFSHQNVNVVLSPEDGYDGPISSNPIPVPSHLKGLYRWMPPPGLTGPELRRYYTVESDLTDLSDLEHQMGISSSVRRNYDSDGSDLTDLSDLERQMGIHADKDVDMTPPPSPVHIPYATVPIRKPLQRRSAVGHFGEVSAPCPTDMSVDEMCTPREIKNYPNAEWATFPSKTGGRPVCRITLIPDDHSQAAKDKLQDEQDRKRWEIMKNNLLKMFTSAKLSYPDIIRFIYDKDVKEKLEANDTPPSSSSSASSSATLVRADTEVFEYAPVSAVSNRFLKATDIPVQIIDGNFSADYKNSISYGGSSVSASGSSSTLHPTKTIDVIMG